VAEQMLLQILCSPPKIFKQAGIQKRVVRKITPLDLLYQITVTAKYKTQHINLCLLELIERD